jgi:hypothetical protein
LPKPLLPLATTGAERHPFDGEMAVVAVGVVMLRKKEGDT